MDYNEITCVRTFFTNSTDSPYCTQQSPLGRKCGVYIQDINGNLWKTKDWDGSAKPNAIAVVTHEHSFRIALEQKKEIMPISMTGFDGKSKLTKGIRIIDACEVNYDGLNNTNMILMHEPKKVYAAGYCQAYIFPDGITHGYLPALGELRLAYMFKDKVEEALKACGGDSMDVGADYHWSSTFCGTEEMATGVKRSCYRAFSLARGWTRYFYPSAHEYVRPFAPFLA